MEGRRGSEREREGTRYAEYPRSAAIVTFCNGGTRAVSADTMHSAGLARVAMRPGRMSRRRLAHAGRSRLLRAHFLPGWDLTAAGEMLPLGQVGACSARFPALWADSRGVPASRNRNVQEVGLRRIVANNTSVRTGSFPVVPPGSHAGPIMSRCRGRALGRHSSWTLSGRCAEERYYAWLRIDLRGEAAALWLAGLARQPRLRADELGLQTGGRPVCCGLQETHDDRHGRQ